MTMNSLNFDLHALAEPKSRRDCIALAKEILSELHIISGHIEQAIARCERSQELAG